MIQTSDALNGAVIKSITARTGDDMQGGFKDDWMGYELIIETDKGTLRFEGCHDCDGEIEVIPNP